jgi:acetyl-CoA synthetase (ADP-forming)
LKKVNEIIKDAHKEGRKFLLEPEAKMICLEYKIPTTMFTVAQNVDEAVKFAKEIGYPVVLKIVSPDIIHKSDVGGVIVNLNSSEEVQDAYNKILENVNKQAPGARIFGVLVQEMAPTSTEVIIGAKKDPQFGLALMFGLGGIFTEIIKDISFRIAPITELGAREMIAEVKGYSILRGYRGSPPLDIDAIVQIIMNTARLLTDCPIIKEFDLNPIMVYEKGAKAVDARIMLA